MRALVLTVLFATAACGGNSNNNSKTDMAVAADMAIAPNNADMTQVENPDLSPTCSTNPMTHLEIINACTSADSVDKMPFYPTLAPNGQLPPLP